MDIQRSMEFSKFGWIEWTLRGYHDIGIIKGTRSGYNGYFDGAFLLLIFSGAEIGLIHYAFQQMIFDDL